MNTNPDANPDTCGYFSSSSSNEDSKEVKNLKKSALDSILMLPPPIPLIPKTLRPSEPFFQSQNISYEILQEFSTQELLEPIGCKVDVKSYHKSDKYDGGVTLKSLFPKDKLVYLRWQHLHKTDFNSNKCDLKKLLLKRKNRESNKEEKNYTNSLIVDKLERFYKPAENDLTLVFESRFESGNLAMASKLSDN